MCVDGRSSFQCDKEVYEYETVLVCVDACGILGIDWEGMVFPLLLLLLSLHNGLKKVVLVCCSFHCIYL